MSIAISFFFFFQAEDGIRDTSVTGVQTCALPISTPTGRPPLVSPAHSTTPGIPAQLPGAMFRDIATRNGIFLPPISTSWSWPIGVAGTSVVGYTIAATAVLQK